jgi:rRNA maturation protein Rpf1
VINNPFHQKEIEAKLEKGIVGQESQSIYSTGLSLQNKLIDEQKLMQMMSYDPDTQNYQELISKLRENPKLLFEIIPGKKDMHKNNLREKIRENQEHYKKALIAKYQIDKINSPENIFKARPGTSGSYMSNENKDIMSLVDQKPKSSATHYSNKSENRVQPNSVKVYKRKSSILGQYYEGLTKDKILKFSDIELSKYMQGANNSKLSIPSTYNQYLRKGRKNKVQNQAIKLASDLFSYYRHPGNQKVSTNSFAIKDNQESFFNGRKRISTAKPITSSKIREFYTESSASNIRVIPESSSGNHPMAIVHNDYSSEIANISNSDYQNHVPKAYQMNISMHNNISNGLSPVLPTLAEAIQKKGMNKSMPRLNQGKMPVAGK